MAEGVWETAAFIGLFGDPFLRNTPYEAGGSPQALIGTLEAFAQVLHPQSTFVPSVDGQRDPLAFVLSGAQETFVQEQLLPQLQSCKEWAERGLKVGDAKQLQAFLSEWKAALHALAVGQPMLVPGGFISNIASHTILYVIERSDDATYSFTVCNKGPGADMYHPQSVRSCEALASEAPGTVTSACDKIRVQSCVQIRGIPATRFLDMAFWSLLFSLWVRKPPSEYHRVETLYDVLLPWLAGDKLLPLAFDDAAATAPAPVQAALATVHTPQRSNIGFCKSAVEALRYLCLRSGAFTPDEIHFALLYKLRYRLYQRTVLDLEHVDDPAKALAPSVLDSALQTLSSIALVDSLQGSHSIASVPPDAVVGIYFARVTCAPCRKFTKVLTALTESLRARGRHLVIILVSVDQEQADYDALVQDLPPTNWRIVPFTEVNARKQLAQTFRVSAVPTLVLRGVDGAILTTRGRELVHADPTGEFFPWTKSTGFALPKAALSLSAQRVIAMATKQIGHKTLAMHEKRSVSRAGLTHVNALMARAEKLVTQIKAAHAEAPATTALARAAFKPEVPFVAHANAGLLQLANRDDEYGGSTAEAHAPTLGNFLDVPERVTSIPLALAAFVRCRNLCESLLTRAAEGSSSSRISLHHEVIQLVTSLFVEVLPVPEPSPAAGAATACMWRQPVAKEMQLRCLQAIHQALMTLGCVWQSMEQPSRHFDSERSLAALCALSMFDALLRTPASDEPLELSLLMEHDGGYVLAHQFCKANVSLAKMTSLMEFARPNFCVARGRVLAYFAKQDALSKFQVFQYHMPEDKVELKKYSTTLIFFRALMEKFNYQLMDPNDPTPRTEMEALMEWFCSDDTPMAREHAEVALTRDLVMVVKFLATMETKEIELMRRRVAHQHWQMWQLSFDDAASSHRRNFFGMRGLHRMLQATLTWEVANFRGSDQDIADVDIVGFMERKVYFGEGPVVSSPADLSALIVSAAKGGGAASAQSLPAPITEDDIMHLNDLPTFHGTLSPEESEYLLSYLTVPYARIPLVAAFFASRDRVTYLFNPMLQQLVRAVLFESGDWVSDAAQEDVAHVPLRKSTLLLHEEAIARVLDARVQHQKCADHLGTMNGLLLNELAHAPDAVVAPLLKMLDAIRELGEASVHSADAKFILFMIKLAVDVLRYVTFALDARLASAASAARLEAFRARLVDYVFGFAHTTLHKWRAEAEAANNLQTACVIHSYLVLLHISLRATEYSAERVASMIGSIAYVRNWHCFGMKLSAENADESTGLTAEERLLRWLQAQGINTENVAKSSLDKYLKGRPLYLKIGMQTIQAPSIVALRDGDGNELQLPPGEVLEEEIFETIQIHRRGIVRWLASLDKPARHGVLSSIVRIALRSTEADAAHDWRDASDVASAGRFVCAKTELKLDTQTGEILWRNDELKPVPDSMTQYGDFKAIFGNKSLHCGLVARQEHRLWVNIIGTDFELVEWDDPVDALDQGVGAPALYVPGAATPASDGAASEELKMYWECPACTCANFNGDNPRAVCDVCATPRIPRAPAPPQQESKQSDGPTVDGYTYLGKTFSRAFNPYSEEEHPHASEQWCADLVGNVLRLQYPPDPEDKKLPFTFFLPADPLPASATRVQLLGHDQGPKDKRDKEKMATFKEIVAYREHHVVHIYSLVTHGRRMYRKLIFTSSSRMALHGFPLTISPDDGPKDPLLLRAAGDPRERQVNGGTLVVLRRNLALNGTEQFVPPRLLQGVVPSCLLEAFRFWLGHDNKLRGEPVDVKSQWFRYRVEVAIANDATAVVTRKSIKTSFSRISYRRDGSGFANGHSRLPPPAPVAAAAPFASRSGAPTPATTAAIEIHDEDVVQLMAMGFSYAACGVALRENHNDVGMAAQWVLDDANQGKIAQAESAAETGDVPMTEADIHEQNMALLLSLATTPSRVAVEYALEVFANDVELAKAWLSDATNDDEIRRVEAAASARDDVLPTPMDVDDAGESKRAEGDDDDDDEAMEVVEEACGETLYLLNALEADGRTAPDLVALAKLLVRVEDLSHVLIWSTTQRDVVASEGSSSDVTLASIAFIELPRLKLKLKPRRESAESIRLDVLDQSGWSVSDLTFDVRPGAVSKHLEAIIALTPDCLVLESDTHDLKLVCPNHDVYRPAVLGEPFSTLLVTDRASVGWQQAMETRFYSYPIHSSQTFVLPPSLSSTLYLILTNLLARNYAAAMELIVGCNVDVTFTEEEKWIFEQLARTLDDRHPNACACRIRLSLGVAYSDNKVPWKLKPELHDYLSTAAHVDASCRLTLEEEIEALANCHQRSPLLSLRRAYCEHVSDASAATFEFKLTRSRVGGQPWMRLGLLGRDYMAAHGKKLSTVRYNRPKHATAVDNSFVLDDDETAKLVWNCAVVGDEVSGSNRGLGFLFLYECLNRQLVLRLGGDECTQSFGDLSARFLHLKLSRWGRETVEDGEEENVPSYPLAQLALLIAHPHERWSASPCDYESTQLLARGANLYSKVTYGTVLKLFFDNSVDEFQAKLQTPVHQDAVVQPLKRQFSRVHESAECVVRVAPASTASARDFGPSNTACDARTFSAATTGAIDPEVPLAAMDVTKFVTFCDPESHVTATLPFDLSQHPAAQTAAARDLLKRLSDDIGINAKSVNESKDAYITGVTPVDKTLASAAAAQSLHELIASCEALRGQDRAVVEREIGAIERIVNETATPTTEAEHAAIDRFVMERRIGVFPRVTFDFVTSLVASTAFEADVRKRNPFVARVPDDLVERILAVLFLCNRIVHINRTIQSARALLSQLTAAAPTQSTDASNRLKQTLQASKDLADVLLSKRHYLQRREGSAPSWTFDPRFVVFEYVFDLLLRGRQVQMIDAFVASLARGDSRVQQMIMGAGKTTVVGPLLTYILADKQHLVTHVMPTALLEQSRQVLRSRFSNLVLRKRIFTFEFDRSVADDPATATKLFVKLNRARQHGDVVCASPESIKSMMLKLVELLHSLEESTDVMELPVSAASQNIRRIRRILEDRSEMADELNRVIRLWQQGVLIMDEVDVLLHPLRSELNFPIGNKFPIDLAANRWELPIHLIDAVLAAPADASSASGDTAALVQQLHAVLADGYAAHSLQKFPHLVLLDMDFYEARMLPILTELALVWLLKHFRMGKMDVDVPMLTLYLTCARAELQSNAHLRATVESGLSDLSIKLLNLARDWLRTILPHVLSKINRVSYGLLRGDHAVSSGGGNSHSRLLLAVPFIGKDVPSRSSEFAHPDVLIGLTILAYRYEGIRVSDLVRIVSQLKQDFSRQLGPRDQRPACALFREWVTSGLAASIRAGTTSASTGAGVLPLPLFQLRDAAQVARLHFLVAKLAGAVYYYVRQHVFPSCMNFQKLKISACGHELGSNALFAKRIGFSGTPSNLLPMDLGECFYEPRSDGSIFQALTSARIVSVERKVNWSAKSLLLDIARASPPYHALIDTGALITGFENQEVAAFLLAHLPVAMEGVVYLDSDDRQMILLRDHNAPMPLVQCGLHPSKRFTFYDQVHTTGMDIKQCVNACAVVTLGKDMTFRDYAQGAYRMRGIETGQSIHLFLIPEVENRIRHEMLLAQSPPLAAMTKDLAAYLLLVPAWLLINSMRMESMQLVQLSLQELHNTWRKRALHALMDEIDAATTRASPHAAPSVVQRMRRFIGDGDAKQWLRACVNKFRVEISYAVESAVPLKRDLSDVIASLVCANESFLTTPAELARVEDVKQRLAHSSSHHLAEDGSEQGDLRLTAEVVHENEAEAEEEAEEEAEQEEQKMSAFTRDDEHPIPWRASVLAESADALATSADADNEDGVFYPFAHFQAHSECPAIALPSNLLVSGNFFRRRWVGLGERRVKNVGLVLEWSPLAQQEAMKTIVHHLFVQVMTATPGIAPNEAAVKALSLAAALPNAAPSDVSRALKADVESVVDAAPVFLVALSLAEGETIRRMIHKNHPVFQTSQVQLRTCEGELVESSSFAASWRSGETPETSARAKRIAVGIQCLRFFNNEMYFAPSELALLLEGLADIPLTLRHEFFECCLRLRRRERHLWGDTPLAKVFTKQDEWHLLSARARMQQFQQSLKQKRRSVHLAVALRRFDENDDGRLSAEEILKCLESFQLGYASAELNEIISLIADVGAFDASGGVPIETICAAFGISKRQMDDALAKDALKQQAELMGEALATWSCPVCTFANDGSAMTCGACSEPNPTTLDDKTAGGSASHQGWRCGNCTFINQPNDVTCAICELGMDGQREVPRGKWICAGEQGGCTFFNPTSSFYCEVCNRARPDLASTRF